MVAIMCGPPYPTYGAGQRIAWATHVEWCHLSTLLAGGHIMQCMPLMESHAGLVRQCVTHGCSE